MQKQQPKPTDSELEILQILWEHSPASVRYVNDRLNEKKPEEVGYTTTLKIMQIMTEKGLVTRNTQSRTHLYSPDIAEDDVQKSLLNRFVNRAFRGSTSRLVMQALGNHQTSKEELEAIKSLIEKLENNQK